MTPENQQIFRIMEPLLAEAGITWSEMLLANDADARHHSSIMFPILSARNDEALLAWAETLQSGSATLEAAAYANLDRYFVELDAWAATLKLRKILKSYPC